MEHKHQTWILAGILGFLVITLLVGRMFNLEWADGDGYRETANIELVQTIGTVQAEGFKQTHRIHSNTTLKRGETVKTEANARAAIHIGDIKLYMDQRTDVTLNRVFVDHVTLTLTRGRVVLIRPNTDMRVGMQTNYLHTTVPKNGSLTMVNYDFQEMVSIIPFENTSLDITHRNGESWTVRETGISIKETPPIQSTPNPFEPKPEEAEFYDWVETTHRTHKKRAVEQLTSLHQ